MTENNDHTDFRGAVFLTAFDENGTVLLEETLTYETYYEDLHPMIDDGDFRRERSIRRIHGRIFDYDATLSQEFTVEYDVHGVMSRSHVVHADGTFIDNG